MRMTKKTRWFLLWIAVMLAMPVWAVQGQGGQVSGLVWLEKNVDGAFSNESGLAGAVVTLEQQAEDGGVTDIAQAVTGRNGNYSLSVPDAGDYRLRIELPAEYRFTLHGLASDALPAQGRVSYTPVFHVSGGQNVTKYIGATKSFATITVIAFEDLNANGGRMNSEPAVSGAQVDVLYAYAGETYVVTSELVGRDGQAIIRELSPGTYRVRISLPENYAVGPLGQKVSGWYNCFLPETADTGITDPITVYAKDNMGVGAGMVRAGSVSGSLWYDADFNGQWDEGETGLQNARITLYSPATGASWETQADSLGKYVFSRLQPGDYRLEISLPDSMVFTYSGSSLISSASSRASLTVAAREGVTTQLGPVGAMPATALSVSLFADQNGSGVQDADEAGIPGASVSAYQDGALVETQQTDAQGRVRFAALRGGVTVLSVKLPEGHVFSQASDSLFSSDVAQSQADKNLFLDGTEGETALSVPVTYPASISGIFFEDPTNTGVYQQGDALLSGFTVQAIDQQQRVAAETVTDASGRYTLSPLLPGVYSVRFLLGDTYVASPFAAGKSNDANYIQTQTPEYGETSVISLAAGAHADGINGSVFQAGLVDGYVLLDGQAGGLAGVKVSLLDQNQQPVSDYAYDITDETGYFAVKGVLPGTYSLLYTLPDNGAFTNPRTDDRTARSQTFACGSGQQVHLPALTGEYTASLSGRILSDTGAPVTAHITLTSQSTGATWDAELDQENAYRFSGLRHGEYVLSVSLPDGLVFGYLPSSPISPAPSSVATVSFTLEPGSHVENVDIRAALPLNVSGHVFYDDNLSGVQDSGESGAEGRTISLWLAGEEIASDETDGEGNFKVSQLVPGTYELRMAMDENEIIVGSSSLGSSEWRLPLELTDDLTITVPIMRYASVSGHVWSLDGTLNGVGGLTVALLDDQYTALASTVTDETGAFSFTGLLPGNYALDMKLPAGYLFAREQDTKNHDSYIQSAANGAKLINTFTVPMGDELSGIDVGIGSIGGIGDRAWLDLNGNGMQDIGEPSIPGILIELYQNGEMVASATTDVYGRYQLTDLLPGEYDMKVTMHPELKPTLHQTEFPLVGSIMPDDRDETELLFSGVIVPSGTLNLHCDLGFVLRTEGVYPSAMNDIPEKDWRPYSDR